MGTGDTVLGVPLGVEVGGGGAVRGVAVLLHEGASYYKN